jgi:hypothetical protein
MTAAEERIAALEAEMADLNQCSTNMAIQLAALVVCHDLPQPRPPVRPRPRANPPGSPAPRGRSPVVKAGCIRPAGYAATAAQFLDKAADDRDGRDLAARQLAALQGIGYALLALGEQLADATDATADCATQLSGIADAVDGLQRPTGGRLRGLLARLLPGGEQQ